jgi:phage terminase small subunit
LLTNTNVKKELNKLIEEQNKKVLITAEEVITELKKIGFADIRQFYDKNGFLKNIKDIPDAVAPALIGLDVDELFEGVGGERERIGQTKKIRMADKVRTLELLAKHLKLLTDKNEVSGPDNGPVRFVVEYDNENSKGHKGLPLDKASQSPNNS